MLGPNGGMVDLRKPHFIKEETKDGLIKRRDNMVNNGWVVVRDLFTQRIGEKLFYCATLKYPQKEGQHGKNIWNNIRHEETK